MILPRVFMAIFIEILKLSILFMKNHENYHFSYFQCSVLKGYNSMLNIIFKKKNWFRGKLKMICSNNFLK